MAPRKGLSFEEKRERLQEIFTETADFFTLKELEKIAPKRKGIVSQSVKEVLQSLVDDSLVNTDKCGVQTVFWCLPSEVSEKRKAKILETQTTLAELEKEEKQLLKEIEELENGRENTEERKQTIGELESVDQKTAKIDRELSRFADFDPNLIKQMEENTVKAKEAANRWIDNIFICRSWASNTFGMEQKMFNTQFGIPEELDYMEN